MLRIINIHEAYSIFQVKRIHKAKNRNKGIRAITCEADVMPHDKIIAKRIIRLDAII
jgi:hypothetical protein